MSNARPWVMNRAEYWLPEFVPGEGDVCVSVTGHRRPEDPLPSLAGFSDVLRLQFDDFDPSRYNEAVAMAAGRPPRFFTVSQAAAVAGFVTLHRGANIVVHCAAGISRSGAIVEAILQAFPEYEDRGWPRHPNGHVLRLMKRAMGIVPLGADEWR